MSYKLIMETPGDVDEALADAVKLLKSDDPEVLENARWIVDEYLDLRLEKS